MSRPDCAPFAPQFALGDFLSRWSGTTRHDLAASDCETLTLAALLEMAVPDEAGDWRQQRLGYADPHGGIALRRAIASRYETLTADDVLCCAGAQEAVSCVTRALLRPGDHAIVVLPIYQPAEQAVTSLCAATGITLRHDRHWQLDLDQLAAAIEPRTRLILVNFPNSPTGACLDTEALAGLIALCRRHSLWLVNDEVYRQTCVVPAARPAAVADLYERGVSINGLSKGFGLPGLRVGWLACRDPGVLAGALLAKTRLSGCLAAPSETLARIALAAETPILARTRAIGLANRDRLQKLFERLPEMFEADTSPSLAFAFPRYRGREGAMRFAQGLASEAGILVAPSELWQSPLAPVPTDRVRISLGHARALACLDALEAHLGAISAAGR